jgi:hypothetical protein
MRYRPCDELLDVLAPAFEPCVMFGHACSGSATWDPARGYVPRGFLGALGSIEEVEVVIIVAEPGDPLPGESHEITGDLVTDIERVCHYAYDHLEGRRSQFHSNMRHLLDDIYPGLSLREQLRRVWITESVLCSAHVESGTIPRVSEEACVDRYLARQLALLPGRPHVPFGRKARERAGRRGLAVHPREFRALAPPGARTGSRNDAAQYISRRFPCH